MQATATAAVSTAPIAVKEVESSQIFAIGHDAATNTLAIRFRSYKTNGPTSLYHYANVPAEVFAELASAKSIGTYFGQNIKPYDKKYPYVQIEKMPAQAAA
ncbi:KTSC domain-containing protein [Burkholderia gladioli]|uniref:KTSC domain-containing protein n=1 Tax=Burkholderia gladioli TaxID=28095 RepID=UPI00164100FA|nr:KTSC domain-containing protein [Burkholderia gladioli]